jgi:hypothetical protein
MIMAMTINLTAGTNKTSLKHIDELWWSMILVVCVFVIKLFY